MLELKTQLDSVPAYEECDPSRLCPGACADSVRPRWPARGRAFKGIIIRSRIGGGHGMTRMLGTEILPR